MRAIGYIRVWTQGGALEVQALAIQPERIKLWCHMNGLDLVSVITDQSVDALAGM